MQFGVFFMCIYVRKSVAALFNTNDSNQSNLFARFSITRTVFFIHLNVKIPTNTIYKFDAMIFFFV